MKKIARPTFFWTLALVVGFGSCLAGYWLMFNTLPGACGTDGLKVEKSVCRTVAKKLHAVAEERGTKLKVINCTVIPAELSNRYDGLVEYKVDDIHLSTGFDIKVYDKRFLVTARPFARGWLLDTGGQVR